MSPGARFVLAVAAAGGVWYWALKQLVANWRAGQRRRGGRDA